MARGPSGPPPIAVRPRSTRASVPGKHRHFRPDRRRPCPRPPGLSAGRRAGAIRPGSRRDSTMHDRRSRDRLRRHARRCAGETHRSRNSPTLMKCSIRPAARLRRSRPRPLLRVTGSPGERPPILERVMRPTAGRPCRETGGGAPPCPENTPTRLDEGDAGTERSRGECRPTLARLRPLRATRATSAESVKRPSAAVQGDRMLFSSEQASGPIQSLSGSGGRVPMTGAVLGVRASGGRQWDSVRAHVWPVRVIQLAREDRRVLRGDVRRRDVGRELQRRADRRHLTPSSQDRTGPRSSRSSTGG